MSRENTEAFDRADLANTIARRAWRVLAPGEARFPAARISEVLLRHVSADAVGIWLENVCAPNPVDEGPEVDFGLDALIPTEIRRAHGIFFTPAPLARCMARQIRDGQGDVVADIAAGDGVLLEAAIRRRPQYRAVGVEKDPLLAVAAAVRILETRKDLGMESEDFVHRGDGLSREWLEEHGHVAAVLGNPPYIREKGNRDVFRESRRAHPGLERFFRPRMDLHYLFLHRALDYLTDGGQLIFLTSEYWLTADSADALRDDLRVRGRVDRLIRLGSGRFAGAPGHESLLLVATAEPSSKASKGGELEVVDARDSELGSDGRLEDCHSVMAPRETLGEDVWVPFAPIELWKARVRAADGPLSSLCRDQQGFVSGADRVSRRNVAHTNGALSGAPIFLHSRDQLFAEGGAAAPVVGDFEGIGAMRPLLRGGDCVANRVWIEPPATEWVYYLDEEIDEANMGEVLRHLGPFRELLERRREVKTGGMPWYRVHWPRELADMLGPKLVVPRRASEPRFCLDLTASLISSDCTYLVAPEETEAPVRYLTGLMFHLNSDRTETHLRHFGKTKGDLIEFYATPLGKVPIAAQRQNGRLVGLEEGVEARLERALSEMRSADGPFLDV